MSIPHLDGFKEFLKKPRQLLKSWYMFFFYLSKVPEVAWSTADWRGLRWFIDTSNREDTFTESVLDQYKEAWSQPGAFTGMLNWYRALFRGDSSDPETMTVDPPTMLIWGTQDPCVLPGMAQSSIDYCSDGRLELIDDAAHRLHHEVPERVNDLMLDFLEVA